MNHQQLLEMTYDAATCFIPEEQLTGEQKEKLDNIRYRFCDCRRCRTIRLESINLTIPRVGGHANKRTNTVSIPRELFKTCLSLPPPLFLLDLIAINLHEIIHILFPDFNEAETQKKTLEWLQSYSWKELAEPAAE